MSTVFVILKIWLSDFIVSLFRFEPHLVVLLKSWSDSTKAVATTPVLIAR